MPPETKDVLTVVIAFVALVVSAYSAWRSRHATQMVDNLGLDDRRFEIVREAMDQKAMLIRQRTALSGLRFKVQTAKASLPPSAAGINDLDHLFNEVENAIRDQNSSIKATDDLIGEGQDVLGETEATPDLLRRVNELLGLMKNMSSNTGVLEANTEEILAEGDRLIQAAMLTGAIGPSQPAGA
jgi:hypothetical protein